MEIGKEFFSETDSNSERKILLQKLHSEEVYQQVSNLYGDFCYQHTRRRTWLLSSRLKPETRVKKIKMLKRFVEITVGLGVSFETYMEAQFEMLIPFLRKRNPRASYAPPFASLVSERAVERFSDYARQQGVKEDLTFYRSFLLDVERSVVQSAERFYDRLKFMKESEQINKQLISDKLEMLARAGLVTNIYVYCSPMVDESNSAFLLEMRHRVSKELTEKQKQLVESVKSKIKRKFEDKDLVQYVI